MKNRMGAMRMRKDLGLSVLATTGLGMAGNPGLLFTAGTLIAWLASSRWRNSGIPAARFWFAKLVAPMLCAFGGVVGGALLNAYLGRGEAHVIVVCAFVVVSFCWAASLVVERAWDVPTY